MKNLKPFLLLTLIVLFTSCVYSQTQKAKHKTSTVATQKPKPTREETVRFIDKTLKLMIGSYYNSESESKEYINEFNFSIDKFEMGYGNSRITYSEIPWDQLIMVDFDFHNNSKQAFLSLQFNTKKIKSRFFNKGKLLSDIYEYIIFVNLSENVVEKKESLIKAFNRLAELAKEENKDPFKN
jgi:hypothetical protein